jgi:hypothetical protein
MNATRMQVKKVLAKLQDVGFELRGAGRNWTIECVDRRANVLVKRALRQAGIRVGGYMAGWGGMVYDTVDRSGYQYTCDFGDRASIHHY